MAINFTGLFTNLGRIASAFRMLTGLLGTNPASPASKWGLTPGGVSGANIHCLTEMLTNIQTLVGSSYPELMSGGNYNVSTPLYQLQTSLPSSISAALTSFANLAQGLILDVVNSDQFIPNLTIQTAMAEVVRQMVSQNVTIHANILSSTVTAGGGNTGNPTIVVGLLDANGANLQYVYSETLTFTTTQDASDGSVAGNETITIKAPAGQVPPSNSYLWPSGNGFSSGFQGSVTVVDPTQSNGSGGNLLNNSSFKVFTTNQPNNWTAGVGVAGTNWQDGTSNNYLGTAHCFEFLGDGSTLASIYQPFANAALTGGSTSTLKPESVYLFNIYYKLSSASGVTGVVTISLVDTTGGDGAVINDNSGNPNTITLNLATVTDTSYHALSGTFRTPTSLPTAGMRIRIKLTTALTSGKNLFLDGGALTLPAQQTYGGIYLGGPYIAAFRGSVDTVDFIANPATGDRWTVKVSNDYGGVWQTFLWQVFNIPQNVGLPVPNAGSPTISDTLII